jgi:hypothetical protein
MANNTLFREASVSPLLCGNCTTSHSVPIRKHEQLDAGASARPAVAGTTAIRHSKGAPWRAP